MATKKNQKASWDEFHAIRRRQRSTVENLPNAGAGSGSGSGKGGSKKAGAAAAAPPPSTTTAASTSSQSTRNERMKFAVGINFQLIVLAFVALDVAAATGRLGVKGTSFGRMAFVATSFEAIWWGCLAVSVVEMVALLLRSPIGYLSDYMRMLDLIVVGVEGHYGHTMGFTAAYLVSVLRLWRIVRIVSIIIAGHKAAFQALQAKYNTETHRTRTLQARLEQATAKWRRESETRQRTEALMKQYKTQFDEFREALAIAAQERMLQSDMMADLGLGEEDMPTAEELEALNAASTHAKFVVKQDGSYSVTTLNVPPSLRGVDSATLGSLRDNEHHGHSHGDHDHDHDHDHAHA